MAKLSQQPTYDKSPLIFDIQVTTTTARHLPQTLDVHCDYVQPVILLVVYG